MFHASTCYVHSKDCLSRVHATINKTCHVLCVSWMCDDVEGGVLPQHPSQRQSWKYLSPHHCYCKWWLQTWCLVSTGYCLIDYPMVFACEVCASNLSWYLFLGVYLPKHVLSIHWLKWKPSLRSAPCAPVVVLCVLQWSFKLGSASCIMFIHVQTTIVMNGIWIAHWRLMHFVLNARMAR